jgi:SAM-dependent methyltransferase
MHAEAFSYVERFATDEPISVLDIGGRNVNGTVRDLFPNADYTALDILPGDGVDIVANAAEWTPDRAYDLIVCTEVFEHTPEWPKILEVAAAACRPGGRIVLTMAGPGRPEHSAIDGGPRRPDEHYGNVDPVDLEWGLQATGWSGIEVEYRTSPADTRGTATRAAVEVS